MSDYYFERPVEELKVAGIRVWPSAISGGELRRETIGVDAWIDMDGFIGEIVQKKGYVLFTKDIYDFAVRTITPRKNHFEAINYSLNAVHEFANKYNMLCAGKIYRYEDEKLAVPIGFHPLWSLCINSDSDEMIKHTDAYVSKMATWLFEANMRMYYSKKALNMNRVMNLFKDYDDGGRFNKKAMTEFDVYLACLMYGLCGFEKMPLKDIAKLPIFNCPVSYLSEYRKIMKRKKEDESIEEDLFSDLECD